MCTGAPREMTSGL
uniref:Uncharacterized protein n=1 Tax=Anguilla anguilla TaxID=7936 RepID=A0A0E9TPI3_ANGAN